jgi:hypothetical protein
MANGLFDPYVYGVRNSDGAERAGMPVPIAIVSADLITQTTQCTPTIVPHGAPLLVPSLAALLAGTDWPKAPPTYSTWRTSRGTIHGPCELPNGTAATSDACKLYAVWGTIRE